MSQLSILLNCSLTVTLTNLKFITPKKFLSLVFFKNRDLKISKSKSEQYIRDKFENLIRLFDEHFVRHFESHWRETWRYTGRRTEPPISLCLETPSPPARNVNLPVEGLSPGIFRHVARYKTPEYCTTLNTCHSSLTAFPKNATKTGVATWEKMVRLREFSQPPIGRCFLT